jgi:putative Ca2+/H+ antiporter (TMEM165/GDT1 family)
MESSILEMFISSALLVMVGEMGDKTQLLSISLAAKYRKPIPILFGILFATLINHALASWLGNELSGLFSQVILSYFIGFIFIGFALWTFTRHEIPHESKTSDRGAFTETALAYFVAEMGDKTQIATVALAAKYKNVLWVTLGTTAGMVIADGLAILIGLHFTKFGRTIWVRWSAAFLFLLFGITSLVRAAAVF